MKLILQWNNQTHSDADINAPIEKVLDENLMMAMATVDMTERKPQSWINSMYFAYTPDMTIYILTYPTAHHTHNIDENTSVALAIASAQGPDQYKVGLQIRGECVPVTDAELAEATEVYAARFPWIRDFVPSADAWAETTLVSRLYKITPKTIKVFSERQHGTEMWMELNV